QTAERKSLNFSSPNRNTRGHRNPSGLRRRLALKFTRAAISCILTPRRPPLFLLARFSRLARTRRPPLVAASPLRYLQGSVGPNNLPSSVMERAQGASNNAAKHRKTNPPLQTWRPVSTQASPREAHLDEISNSRRKQMAGTSITDSENSVLDETTNVGIEVTTNNTFLSESSSTFSSSATKVAAENTMEVIREKYSSSVEVDVPLMHFLKGKGGSVQKQIEQETGVKIIFPSGKEETLVVLEGKSAESIGKVSERIAKILEEGCSKSNARLLAFHITSIGHPPRSCREAQ
uniref:K Homology domain-containing protein n=1 Tax=Aegilops tauschii subsp. strangulata TaxID=200361 RepID=A0A453EIB0_AEGTS